MIPSKGNCTVNPRIIPKGWIVEFSRESVEEKKLAGESVRVFQGIPS